MEQAAPEEAAARKAKEDGVGEQVEFDPKLTLIDQATAGVLVVVAVSLVWMSARAMGMPAMASEAVEVSAVDGSTTAHPPSAKPSVVQQI